MASGTESALMLPASLGALALAAALGAAWWRLRRRSQAAARALHDSQERLHMALSGAGMVSWDWDLPSGAMVCSPDWAHMLGDGPQALPATIDAWRARIHPDERAEAVRLMTRHLDGHSPLFEVEYRIQRTDGAWIWLLVRGKVVARSADGQPLRLTGTGMDISERKAAQQAAEDDRVRTQAILQTCSDGIHIVSENGRLLEANPAFLQMLGLGPDAVGRLHVSDWDPAVTRENFGKFSAKPLGRDEARPLFEATHRRVDGRLLQVEVGVAHMVVNGQTMYCAVSRDISRRKRVEQELAAHRQHLETLVASRTAELTTALQAAEAASRTKSAFLANMSHELRTPLAGVMGMTELALRRATDARQIDQLNKSQTAARHLLGVISDVLDLSRIEADKMHLTVQDFNLAQVLDDAVAQQASAAEAKGLALVTELDPRLPLRLTGDAARVQQILVNFISNAVKFSDQGRILVRAEPETTNPTDAQGALLRLSVSDQGQGISAAQQARLFQPFAQADDSATRRHNGAGLGLVIARRLAQLMGGDAGLHSVPGEGSTAWATVPLAPARGSARSALPSTSAQQTLIKQFGGTRVLLADDHPVNREVTAALLGLVGLQVDLAVDGLDAVRQASAGGHSLILMDVQMPGLSGLQAARELRQMPGLQQVPILAMTARAFDEDKAQSLAAGMNDHLTKPFQADQLYASVLHWLRHGAQARARQPLRDIANSSKALSVTSPGHKAPDNQR